jgi:RimJ/RimL family protein N-acetyltransferase
VRALRPGDEVPVQTVFDGMSAKSRLMRYLAATPMLSSGARRRLAEVDHRTRGAWVARDADLVVGIARYAVVVLDGGIESAEIALEVVDTHQGNGVGGFLIDVLAIVLEGLNIDRWHWSGSPSNTAMRRLAARSGATWRYESGELVAHARVSTVRPRRVPCGGPEILA